MAVDMKTTTKYFGLISVILMVTLLDWPCALMTVTGESGSGMDAPEEVTMDTWQYCIVDNSTILRLDTGEQLDIVYIYQQRYTCSYTKSFPNFYCVT